MLGEWVRTVGKLVLVVGTIALAVALIFLAYQFAFPPSQQTARLELPQLNLLQCTQPGAGIDPADLAYSYQLQQHENELTLTAGNDNHETTFTVDSGELPADVSVRLEREGFIRDSDLFLTLLKCRHASEKIQAGDHVLRRNMTMDDVIVALQIGTQRGITITVRPGWRAEQIADYLSTLNLPQFDKAEFLRLVKAGANFDYAFLNDRPKSAAESAEGYLFPETYNVLQGITAEQMINRFLSEFDQRVTPDLRAKGTAQNLTLLEVITLASIVEREAVAKEEGPIIASVYLNRLKKKMVLNADPTVQYAIGFQPATKQWWPVIPLAQYGKVDSPYNTYIYSGLPPGPICEPGLNSILAALEPANTDYLYFLAKGDGTHVFARVHWRSRTPISLNMATSLLPRPNPRDPSSYPVTTNAKDRHTYLDALVGIPPHVVGGIGTHVSALVPALAKRGIDVTVITPRWLGGEAETRVEPNARIYRVEPSFPTIGDYYADARQTNVNLESFANSVWSAEREVDGQGGAGFDLIHAHDWLVAFAAIGLKRLHKVPLVATMHATERGRGRGRLMWEISRSINETEWSLAYEAWRVITASQFMAEEVRSYFQLPPDKIEVVPNGVETTRFDLLSGTDLTDFPRGGHGKMRRSCSLSVGWSCKREHIS